MSGKQARQRSKTPARSKDSVREVKQKAAAKRRTVSQTQAEEDETQRENKKRVGEVRRNPRNSINQDKEKTTEPEQCVSKSVLREFALSTVKKGVDALVSEFTEIKAATANQPAKTAFEANPEKNRYKDVICADESRIVLNWPPNAINDYIHANAVNIRGSKRFICTQGPLDRTIDDFYRMVWGQKCRAIVQLCNTVELGKPKCAQYYPEKVGETMTTSSNITIKNLESSEAEKMLQITLLELSVEGELFTVRHYFWKNWPDRGVPVNTMACLRLLARLKAFSPVIVHCSAGIGRTGTIVGLEMANQAVLHGETLSFPSIVRELRSFRHGSVQTDIQYVYMHRVMLVLAENKKVVQHEEVKAFHEEFEAFLKSRGC